MNALSTSVKTMNSWVYVHDDALDGRGERRRGRDNECVSGEQKRVTVDTKNSIDIRALLLYAHRTARYYVSMISVVLSKRGARFPAT
jgi:hypothetical protein